MKSALSDLRKAKVTPISFKIWLVFCVSSFHLQSLCLFKRNIILADTFEEAFGICVSQAKPGDAVLLSPACASWGMFTDYEARGRIFKELVEKIGV